MVSEKLFEKYVEKHLQEMQQYLRHMGERLRRRKETTMSSSAAPLSTPEGPGSGSGAPNLPAEFTDTFTSRAGDGIKPAADDVQTLVIPGTGHWVAEQAPEEMVAALTAFLAPYREVGGGLR